MSGACRTDGDDHRLPLIFAYAETPAEKLERLRKELENIKSNISAVENSKEKSEQTKQYYQAQANNLKAQLAAIKEDIAAQQQSIELKKCRGGGKKRPMWRIIRACSNPASRACTR